MLNRSGSLAGSLTANRMAKTAACHESPRAGASPRRQAPTVESARSSRCRELTWTSSDFTRTFRTLETRPPGLWSPPRPQACGVHPDLFTSTGRLEVSAITRSHGTGSPWTPWPDERSRTPTQASALRSGAGTRASVIASWVAATRRPPTGLMTRLASDLPTGYGTARHAAAGPVSCTQKWPQVGMNRRPFLPVPC